MNGIQEVMTELRKQRTAIEEAIIALERVFVEGGQPTAPPMATVTTVVKKASPRGGMTLEGRKRLAEAMKRRWAVKRAASQVKKRAKANKGA